MQTMVKMKRAIFLNLLFGFVIFYGYYTLKKYGFNLLFKEGGFALLMANLNDSLCVNYLSETLITLTFEQLLLMDFNENKFAFAAVVPSGVTLKNLSDEFCGMIQLLENNGNILMVAGNTVMPWKPVCRLIQDSWTVKMSYNYSSFETGSSTVSYDGYITCYACDLLPDIFVIKLNELSKYEKNFTSFLKLNKSAHLPFFTLFIGRSAYCPDVHLYCTEFVEDFSCNNLSSRWDEAFAYVPAITNIFCLISPTNLELWLGCVWWKKAYVLDLPIHCSNFVRQYLFDIVDILENRYKVDYRVIEGTLLGALREKEVIPWSFDVDLYVPAFDGGFLEKWSQVPKYSSGRYSCLTKDFILPAEPARAFPMCPVLLSARDVVANDMLHRERNVLLTKIMKQIRNVSSSFGSNWRSFGYVDLYKTSHLDSCDSNHMKEKTSTVEIYHKFFKIFANSRENVVCNYGADFMTTFPDESLGEWNII